jgi:hypothetical protein
MAVCRGKGLFSVYLYLLALLWWNSYSRFYCALCLLLSGLPGLNNLILQIRTSHDTYFIVQQSLPQRALEGFG